MVTGRVVDGRRERDANYRCRCGWSDHPRHRQKTHRRFSSTASHLAETLTASANASLAQTSLDIQQHSLLTIPRFWESAPSAAWANRSNHRSTNELTSLRVQLAMSLSNPSNAAEPQCCRAYRFSGWSSISLTVSSTVSPALGVRPNSSWSTSTVPGPKSMTVIPSS